MSSKMTYIELESGCKYFLDVDKIIEWCTQTTNERSIEININETHKPDMYGTMRLLQRQTNETKLSGGVIKGSDGIRYEIFMTLMQVFVGMGITSEHGGGISKHMRLDDISISESIVFNTLIDLEFLVKL